MTRALALAFPLALAACGGGKSSTSEKREAWSYEPMDSILALEGGTGYLLDCGSLIEKRKKGSPKKKTILIEKAFLPQIQPQSGMVFCSKYLRNIRYTQTKNDGYIVTISQRATSDDFNYSSLESELLAVVARIGTRDGFKYGVFDNIEERERASEGHITGSTSRSSGRGTGIETSLYNSVYSSHFGNANTTTTIERTSNKITVERKHIVRFYHSEPDTDKYFELNLILKSSDWGLAAARNEPASYVKCFESYEGYSPFLGTRFGCWLN